MIGDTMTFGAYWLTVHAPWAIAPAILLANVPWWAWAVILVATILTTAKWSRKGS